ncbi:hypothetical protein LCGC14_0848790 [marine sediment metagenome]|uniref:Large polyvalent protein associated domain-containing protein n=1 Tax=marine sediment metagenome TaxID=412755 RepID=A0A0F9PW84_9ZZZZ
MRVENPDASTMLEELFHVARRAVVVDDDLATLETFYKVKDGVWDAPAEERASGDFQAYIASGKAPTAGLVRVFQVLKEAIMAIYKGVISNIPNSSESIPREVRAVFDRMLHEDSSQITQIRAELDELDEIERILGGKIDEGREVAKSKLRDLQQRDLFTGELPSISKVKLESGALDSNETKVLVDARTKTRNQIVLKEGELERAQERTFEDEISEIDNAISEEVVMSRVLGLEAEQLIVRKGVISYWKDTLGSIFNQAFPLLRRKSGQATAFFIKDADAWARGIQGRLITEGFDAYKQLDVGAFSRISTGSAKSKDVALLSQIDDTGTSMIRRIMDPVGTRDPVNIDSLDIPEDQKTRLKNLKNTMQSIFREIAEEATNIKALRTLEDGSRVISRPTEEGKIPRLATDELWKAVSDGSGPLYDAVIRSVLELNPELTVRQAKSGLDLWIGPKTIRRNGSIEDVRKIKKMPDHVFVDGKIQAIMHTDPFYIITRGVELQTKRLAMIKYFGQGDALQNLNVKNLKILASKIGVNLKFSKDQIQDRVVKRLETLGGSAELYDKMSIDDLKALARGEDLSVDIGREDIIDRLLEIDPDKLRGEQREGLIGFARNLGGIEITEVLAEGKKRTPRPIKDIFNDVLLRTGFDAPKNFQRLRARFADEGGDTRDFDNVFRVWQGLPINGKWIPRNPATRILRVSSRVAGALQTSLSVSVNTVQTLALVPSYGNFFKFADAVAKVLISPEMTRAQVTALGAFRETLNHWQIERGFYPEGLARNLQQAIATGTGLRFVADMNNTIAGQMGLAMVKDFRNYGAAGADIRNLRKLGLSEREISLARKGKIAKLTETKIVSNLVAKTQFVSEAAPFRGKIENMPIARILFAYSNYTLGATRALVDTMSDVAALPRAVKDGNFAEIYGTLRSTMTMLVGTLGAGLAGSMLRQALKGRAPEEPTPGEEKWKTTVRYALTAMAEVQLLGATQRVLDPFKFGDSTIEKVLIGFTPKVTFISNLLGGILGMSKFGRFGVVDRSTKAFLASTPVAAATARYVEQIAFPGIVEFRGTQQISGKFAREILKKESFIHGDVQINPLFFNVFESLKRSDIEGAISDAKIYYRKRLGDTKFLSETLIRGRNPLKESVRTLRQSLLARQPGNFDDVDTIRFFRALTTEDRKRAARVILRYRRFVDIVAPR